MSLVRQTLTLLFLDDFHDFIRYLRHSNRYGNASKRDISVCVFGPASSGKTSLINSLFGSASDSSLAVDVSCPTVGYRQYAVKFDQPNVLARVIFKQVRVIEMIET
jgi:GTPase SAR1 family protein